jgi:hypothetical protein
VRHVACVEEKSTVYMVLGRKPEGKRCPGRPSVDGRIILKWILNI